MVYLVSSNRVYDDPVYPTFLDATDDNAFNGIAYEQDPATLDLRATEREALAKGSSAIEHGYRVVGDNAPSKMLWEGGSKDLPEIIQKNCLAVSPRFRDLVEKFEPGVHQFFPVEIYKNRNAEPVALYYWINVCNRIDSIDPESSNLYWKPDYSGARGVWREKEGPRKKVFSLARIGDRHLWMDPYLSTHRYFYCTSQFGDEAQLANFPGLTLTKQEEV